LALLDASKPVDQEEVSRYLDGFAMFWESMGASALMGRLFGYLLVSGRRVSLDELSSELEASKSSLSVASRQLVQFGMARRITQRGSRRVLYEAVESFESLVELELQRRVAMIELVSQGMRFASTPAAKRRMHKFIVFNQYSVASNRKMLAEWIDRDQQRRAE